LTACTASVSAAAAATGAQTAAVTAHTAAETTAAAAIATASASSAASLAALAAAATGAAAALAAVGGSSASGFLNGAGGLELFGSLGFAGGGRPPLGRVSVVGEEGPELFIPDSAGTILSNRESLAAIRGNQSVLNVGGLQVNINGNADRRNVEQVRVAVARGLADAAKRRTAG
jgi:hypothetical protein